MHLLARVTFVSLCFCGTNALIDTHTASKSLSSRSLSSIRLLSSSQPSSSNRTSLSSQRLSSSQQRPTDSVLSSNSQQSSSTQRSSLATGKETSSLAEGTNVPSLRTGEDISKAEAHVNSSVLSNTTSSLKTVKDTTKLAPKGNTSSPSNTTLQEDITAHSSTYNVWTIDSTDANGNKAIWNFLVSLGIDGSDINVLGLPPGLDDTDAFQLRLSPAQYKSLNASVSIYCLTPREA